MTLKRKIEKTEELDREKLEIIRKGAPVVEDMEKKMEKPERKKRVPRHFMVRMYEDMYEEIDEAVSKTVGLTKTGWILQAIQEKLRRDSEANEAI